MIYAPVLSQLKLFLKGRVSILGIGNTLRKDDGAGSILAGRIKNKTPFSVWDTGVNPENYLEKIIAERPDTLLVIDTADFGGQPGELRILKSGDVKTINLFFTHNASIEMMINYLKSRMEADIIILVIQPYSIAFGEELSPPVSKTIEMLEDWFYGQREKKG